MTHTTQGTGEVIKTDALGRLRTSVARRESLLEEFVRYLCANRYPTNQREENFAERIQVLLEMAGEFGISHARRRVNLVFCSVSMQTIRPRRRTANCKSLKSELFPERIGGRTIMWRRTRSQCPVAREAP